MTDYNAIPDEDLEPGKPWTSIKALRTRDNPIAIAEGAVGAPRIVSEAVNWSTVSNEIGQAQAKTASGSVSVQVTSAGFSSSTTRVLPGGQYGFYPEVRGTNDGTGGSSHAFHLGRWNNLTSAYGLGAGDDFGFENSITLYVEDGGSDADPVTQARQRYLTASRPYDLGDGECGLFVEADMLPNGKIAGLYVAPNPVWAYSGSNSIVPDRIDHQGRAWKMRKKPALTMEDVRNGVCDMSELSDAIRCASIEYIEITPEYKNMDMNAVPHSWVSEPMGTIVIIDPVNTFELLRLHDDGEDVVDIINKGYLDIDNNQIEGRKGPPGVQIHSSKWRNTRK